MPKVFVICCVGVKTCNVLHTCTITSFPNEFKIFFHIVKMKILHTAALIKSLFLQMIIYTLVSVVLHVSVRCLPKHWGMYLNFYDQGISKRPDRHTGLSGIDSYMVRVIFIATFTQFFVSLHESIWIRHGFSKMGSCWIIADGNYSSRHWLGSLVDTHQLIS